MQQRSDTLFILSDLSQPSTQKEHKDKEAPLPRSKEAIGIIKQLTTPSEIKEGKSITPEIALSRAITLGRGISDVSTLCLSCNLDQQDPSTGKTALHLATEKKDVASTSLLLSRQASSNIPDAKGVTAVGYAARSGDHSIQKLIYEALVKTANNAVIKQYPQDLRTFSDEEQKVEIDYVSTIYGHHCAEKKQELILWLTTSIALLNAYNNAAKLDRALLDQLTDLYDTFMAFTAHRYANRYPIDTYFSLIAIKEIFALLLMNPDICNGTIPVKIYKVNDKSTESIGSYYFLLLGGNITELSPSTILYSNSKIYTGQGVIEDCLSVFKSPQYETSVIYSNEHPDLSKFDKSQIGYLNILEILKVSFLKENPSNKKFFDLSVSCLRKTAQQSYSHLPTKIQKIALANLKLNAEIDDTTFEKLKESLRTKTRVSETGLMGKGAPSRSQASVNAHHKQHKKR